MKWAFSIKNKVKASLILLLLCGVILFSNYRLKRLSQRVADSVETIYEDRLVVQDLIFSFSGILDTYENKGKDAPSWIQQDETRHHINELHTRYEKTYLTEEEKIVYNSFTNHLWELSTDSIRPESTFLEEMKDELRQLEAIQMKEAKIQMGIIKKAKGNQEAGFYLETAVLVVFLVIVQVLVVASTPEIRKIVNKENINLN